MLLSESHYLFRHQISISKRLIEEGINCWNLISNYNHHVLWENLVSGLQEHFLKMTFGRIRSLTHQVLFFLFKLVGSLKEYFKKGYLEVSVFSEVPNPLTHQIRNYIPFFNLKCQLCLGRFGGFFLQKTRLSKRESERERETSLFAGGINYLSWRICEILIFLF